MNFEEIWRIVKKFIPVVQFMTQSMHITGITMKFISYFIIILFFIFNWEFIINCNYCESMFIGNCKYFYKKNYGFSYQVK